MFIIFLCGNAASFMYWRREKKVLKKLPGEKTVFTRTSCIVVKEIKERNHASIIIKNIYSRAGCARFYLMKYVGDAHEKLKLSVDSNILNLLLLKTKNN